MDGDRNTRANERKKEAQNNVPAKLQNDKQNNTKAKRGQRVMAKRKMHIIETLTGEIRYI